MVELVYNAFGYDAPWPSLLSTPWQLGLLFTLCVLFIAQCWEGADRVWRWLRRRYP